MASALDAEMEQLQERAALLRKTLDVHTSTLLSAPSTRALLHDDSTSGRRDSRADRSARENLLQICGAHAAHQQQCLYRAGASVTAFSVRDPDPNAVDDGRVLGLRLDVMMGAQFLRPYYVLLHRGVRRGPLCIHRHTVPPCIPLAALATRFLAKTATTTTTKMTAPTLATPPDLYGFVRALRRALVRYHNRLAVIGDMRRAVQKQTTSDTNTTGLVDVSGADAEAKQIRLDWADLCTGRLVLDDDGGIAQLVVMSAEGNQDRATARALLAGETTAIGLVRRLEGA